MDLFWIYCNLYRIYAQDTFSAITFDSNEILTCSFFIGLCGFRTITVNYGYSRNVGNLRNI